MFGKAVLVLVLAAVAVQSYVPYDVEEEIALADAKNDGLIQHLREIIEKALKAFKEVIAKVHKELAEKIKQLIEIAKTKFSKQYHEIVEKIKKLKEEAKKLKVDVKECVKGHEEELKTLNKEFNQKLEACNKDIISQSKTLVEKEEKNVEESVGVIKKLAADLAACKGADALKCKAKVAIEIAGAIRDIPAKITKAAAAAAPTILRLVPAAEKCLAKETQGLIAAELKIAKTIETCIKQKLHPKA